MMNILHNGLDFLFDKLAGIKKKKVAVVCPYEDDALLAVDEARKRGFVSAVLVGEIAKIKPMADKVGVALENFEILEATGEPEAAEAAVRAVSSGNADILMKGMIKTATLLKAVLNKEWGLRGEESSLLSHIMFAEIPALKNRVYGTTDGGMNMYPDIKAKVEIIKNSVACLHKLGLENPKVALLSGNDGVAAFEEKIPQSITDAAVICRMNIAGCLIEGPLTLENSLEHDLLVVPDIDSGNMLGKATIYMAGATCAGVILGARKPVIMLSRHDTQRTKLCSIALGAVISE